MPNRILKESITTSATVDALTSEEECFFYRLLVVADDFGRMDGRPAILRARCFPLRVDHIKDKDIHSWVDGLIGVGLVRRYVVDSAPYLEIVTWAEHQQIRAQRSRYPGPVDSNCYQESSSDDRFPRNPNTNTNPNPNPIHDAAPAGADETDVPPRKVVRLASTSDYSEAFNRFWSAYPRRVNKHGAWLEWQRRLKEGAVEDELIRAADNLARYAEREGTEEHFIPHASTFIGRQRRFEDFVSGLPAASRPPPVRAGPNGRPSNYDRNASNLDAAFGPESGET